MRKIRRKLARTTNSKVRDTYRLHGQSNMRGSAAVSALTGSYAEYAPALTGVNIYYKPEPDDGITSTDNGSWQVLDAGVNQNTSDHLIRFGPELSFGKAMRAFKGQDIDLIKYAVGGTTLNARTGLDWAPSTSELYTNANSYYYEPAVAKRAAAGITNNVKAYLWNQGETDAITLSYANAYETNFRSYVSTARTYHSNSNLLFIYCRIGSWQPYTYLSTVRAAQEACAEYYYDFATNSLLPSGASNPIVNTVMISLDDDDRFPRVDEQHLNHVGQINLGLDFFNICKLKGA